MLGTRLAAVVRQSVPASLSRAVSASIPRRALSALPTCSASSCYSFSSYSSPYNPSTTALGNRPLHSLYTSIGNTHHRAFTELSSASPFSTGETKKKSGLQQDVSVTGVLAEIVDGTQMSRLEITRRVWTYIKERNLQAPEDKRRIQSGRDEKLRELCGGENEIVMFHLGKYMKPYIHKLP